MKLNYSRNLFLLLLLFGVVSCKGANGDQSFVSPLQTELITTTTTSLLREPTVPSPSQPQDGKATLVGRVVSRREGTPISDVAVRLAEVYRQEGEEGAFVLDDTFSPGSTTDEDGRFKIENVKPKEYVIVVGDARTQYDIISKPSGQARVWEIPPDQIFDAGELEVELHP